MHGDRLLSRPGRDGAGAARGEASVTRLPTNGVELDWGEDEPIRLPTARSARVAVFEGPQGLSGSDATRRVASLLEATGDVPPLATHVVPGDRVVIAICDPIPQCEAVLEAVRDALDRGGIPRHEPLVLDSRTFEEAGRSLSAEEDEARTAYLAADAEGEPLHLDRCIVDADVVIAIGEWSLDATLPGRSTEGELWPAFSRHETLAVHARRMLLDRRGTLGLWRKSLARALDQLGVIASLRLVRGRNGSLADAFFGIPDRTARAAKACAAAWRPMLSQPADCTIFTLHQDPGGPIGPPADPCARHASLADLARGIAAAARLTAPDGTICGCCHVTEAPGPVVARWREGVSLEKLVREAFRSGDEALVADARLAVALATALGTRRLVLLSDIDPDAVEMLGFGHAESPDAVRRLARSAQSLAVLQDADRMLPVRPTAHG